MYCACAANFILGEKNTCLKQRYKIFIRLFTGELSWKKEAFALLLYVLGLQLLAIKWELSSVTDETQSRKAVEEPVLSRRVISHYHLNYLCV